jgi:hypothetical protein
MTFYKTIEFFLIVKDNTAAVNGSDLVVVEPADIALA